MMEKIKKMKTKRKDHHQPDASDVKTSLTREKHTPVLLSEVMQYLQPQKGDKYLDVTAGYGGHAQKILASTLTDENSVLVDQDKTSVEWLKEKFSGRGIKIIKDDFLTASQELLGSGKTFDIILADIGVSSEHLDNMTRGFSFKNDGPLDMRMDQSQELTAEKIVNRSSKAELVEILRKYGEEPKAAKVAEQIISSRPIESTGQLARVVASVFKNKSPQKKHVATKTFQALRIAVNDELGQLKKALPIWLELLSDDGRLAIISFHSLEDRTVKQFFAKESGNRYDARLKLLTKKPVTASQDELVSNPRARSAKLRAVAKIKTKKGAAYVDSST